MAKNAIFGIQSIKFATPVAGGFPTEWTGFDMKAIVKDSVSFNDNAASENNIEVEDMDEYYATLESERGTSGFTIKGYDLSKEAYAFFYGYAEDSEKAYSQETPGFKLGNKAVQIITKSLGTEFKARQFEWANMKLTVVNEGTIGKSGFPNISITCVKQANLDEDGTEKPGARWKEI